MKESHSALLDDALVAYVERAPDDCASLSEMDGMLAAVAIGPEDIPDEEWLALMWGDSAPVFRDGVERAAVTGALIARKHEIIRELSNKPSTYAPFLWRPEEEGEAPDASDWAYGFMVGVGMRLPVWEKFLHSEDGDGAMAPIYMFLPEENEDLDGLAPEELADVLSEAAELLPVSVVFIHEHFRRKRMGRAVRAEAAARPAPPERNDPCPCGSGAKYKKCCGAAA
ncbi:MAG: UPF0149 family protein [Hyphomonadaceae bacterium]|nr:UPF0149 family protein [Hyphomonadaceae bacterium]